jgi:hypothetical protein
MNIVLKNKINKNGDLCICIIDHMYPQNDDEIQLSRIQSRLPVTTLKMKRFYKMINIGTSLVKENRVPVKYKDAINTKMDHIRRELLQRNLTIVDEKSSIVYQRDQHHVKDDRKSCEIFDCFK